MSTRSTKWALAAVVVALIAFNAWAFYDSTYSRAAYELRKNTAINACHEAHPINKHSTGAEFDAATACFNAPTSPPGAWLVADRAGRLVGAIFLGVLLIRLYRERVR
jgi:hypothetical protein